MNACTQTFETSSEDEIRSVLDRIERVLAGRPQIARTERRRYLDTFDWRIVRSGAWLCEESIGSGRKLLYAANGERPVSAVAKKTPKFASDLPEGPIRHGLQTVLEPRRLMRVAEVIRTAQTVELRDVEDKVVCRVIGVTAELTGIDGADPWHYVVLEGVRGYEKEFQAVDHFLRYQLRLQVSENHEIDEVLAHLDEGAGRDASELNIELSPRMSAGEAVRLLLSTLCEVLVVNRKGLLQDLDTEFLHDFRVAVRRTRSILSQVGNVLPAEATDRYLQEFRWLGELTGPARDLDVLLMKLPTYRRELATRDASALEGLLERIRSDRTKEQAKLTKALRGERFRKLISSWKSFLSEPVAATEVEDPLAEQPVLHLARRRTWKRYRSVRRIGRKIHHGTPSDELHRLRIECKKLRYLLELFRTLYEVKPVTSCIKELKRLQNTLGDFNDAQVHADMLRDFAVRIDGDAEGSSETILAIGSLVSALNVHREKEREQFFERFEQFSEPKNHERFRQLLKTANKVDK